MKSPLLIVAFLLLLIFVVGSGASWLHPKTGMDLTLENMRQLHLAGQAMAIPDDNEQAAKPPATILSDQLPADVVRALAMPGKAVLYSLEPTVRSATPGDDTLHGFKVLGQTELNADTALIAAKELQSAVLPGSHDLARCFEPRHALRVTSGDQTYDLIICYSCLQLRVYQSDKLIAMCSVKDSPKVLNGLLTAAKIPQSPTYHDKKPNELSAVGGSYDQLWLMQLPQSLTYHDKKPNELSAVGGSYDQLWLMQLLLTIPFYVIWFFFLIHAVQRIDDPVLRAKWVIAILFFNLFGVIFYLFCRYRHDWRNGRGGLIRTKTELRSGGYPST